MKFTILDIIKATKGRVVQGGESLECEGVSTDTRTLVGKNLFIAIKGAHFDGHDFLGDAKAAGAVALVVEKGASLPKDICAVEVKDTCRALGDIASWWRGRFSAPCLAITGSNGKSTTKEMTAAIAGELGAILKTEGNFNNLIGLPLTVFRWEKSHRAAILEVGMNAPGEIKRLTEIAVPDIALITNVTAAHLEKLHSVEAVARAKGELFEAMRPDGTAVVNIENKWVKELGMKFPGRKITFGMQNTSDIRFLHMETEGLDKMDLKLSVMGKEFATTLPVPGAHNVMNALAAIGMGVALGIDPERAVERLSDFHPMAMRFERVQLANGVRVVNDSYNANPESMAVALRTVGSAKRAGKFVAALGDMLELGSASEELHRQLGETVGLMGVNTLYVTGDFADAVAEAAKKAGMSDSQIIVCENAEIVSELLENDLHAGDVLLVKGSRGMRMERIVERLKNSIGME